ncbi:MAG: hypothetical protein OXI22_11240 [Defluviicoccus sp.]|nr:hypothetical protein [Defluviicoccus sp.]MDE0384449.1 hypothetical protein [Defluviicoccus sp.]
MRVSKAALALSLALGVWVAGPPGLRACDGVAAHRVKERVPGAVPGSRGLIAVGDFDGDGNLDKAFFLEKTGALALVACLEGGTRLSTIFELGGIGALASYGIRTIPRGTRSASCAAGEDPDCGAGRPEEIGLDREAIEFRDYRKSSFLLRWSGGAWTRVPRSE